VIMKIGVLVSGSGTNLQALLDAEAGGTLAPGEIAVVVSNRPGVPALARATAAGKHVVVVDHKAFAERGAFEDAVIAALAPLTPRQRAAVVLMDVLGLSSEEAARALGVRPSTVRVLAGRGRERLRREMNRNG